MESSKERIQFKKPTIITTVICFAVILAFWFIPPAPPMTVIGMRVLGVFIGTILLLSLVDTVWPAVLAIVLLSRTGVTSLNGAIGGTMGSWIVFFVLMSFVMTHALNESGFTDRLVARFMSMRLVSKSPWTFTVAMAVIGLILASFIDQIPATAFMLMFSRRVYQELGYTEQDAYPHVANIMVVYGVIIGGLMTPISHSLAILGMAIYEGATGVPISLFTYLVVGVPTGLVLFVALTLIMRFAAHPDMSRFKDFDVQKVLAHRGPMQVKELITVIVFFGTVIMWMLPGVAGMFTDAPWVGTINSYGITFWAICAVVVMSIISTNEKPIIDLKDIVNHHVNWGILIFISIGVFLGSAMANDATGIPVFITEKITPVLDRVSPLVVVLIITMVSVFLTNFASNVLTITVMTTVGVSIGLASGGRINPAAIALCTSMAGAAAYLLPSSFGCIAMLHGDEYSNSKKVYLYGLIMCIVSPVIIGLIGYNLACAVLLAVHCGEDSLHLVAYGSSMLLADFCRGEFSRSKAYGQVQHTVFNGARFIIYGDVSCRRKRQRPFCSAL
ncbi:MAG: anion permease [Treponema sp.]|nr:anion permease [Treponema sp.]